MQNEAHRRLEAVLERELDAARSLGTVLQAERAALTGDSPEAVLKHAAEKTALFGAIEDLETQRRDLCAAAQISLPNLQRGRTPVIEGVSETVADRWRALLDVISGCRIANEVNGYIINARRGQIGQLLSILRGGKSVTYGPQGMTPAKSLRELARA